MREPVPAASTGHVNGLREGVTCTHLWWRAIATWSASPDESNRVRPFVLDEGERAALLAFLRSLTDEAFLRDPRFADPWPR